MEEQIQFENHLGETLVGTLHLPEGQSVGAVVAGHCFTCSRHTGILRHVAAELSRVGFSVLRFDFSGNGQSQGAFSDSTWSKQIREMAAAVALMRGRGAVWIGLIGHSLGAAIALLTAGRDDGIGAICRLAGRVGKELPLHFLTPAQQHALADTGTVDFTSRGRRLHLNRDFFDDAGRYDLTAKTRALKIPILMVHGDQDTIIPVSEARLAKAANPDRVELLLVNGGDHMFSRPEHQQQVSDFVAAWFRRQVDVSSSNHSNESK
ncbi:OsmC-like protein [Desulfosarcina cetonica]|uniref:alpha/beta hydrolase n=1 Tax=Desulfosarcina cetonica TaxID=90730 RepID=UPI0006CFCD68|nr:alpha/beta hydrolase [Desulfosarcina cetonica]VTR68055.1 OsmC-like protein [Desulfosarcina cetonica]